MYCIGFNGPPRSGKDSIARCIEHQLEHDMGDGMRMEGVTPTLIRSLSMPMRKVAFAMIDRPYSFDEYEEVKDKPFEVFNGQTMRQFMIAFSETFAKFNYGDHVWANSLLSGLGTGIHLPGLCMIPDVGFQPETERLVEAFGEDNFLLVRTHRRSTDFSRDSRRYVSAPLSLNLNNNGKLEAAADLVLGHVRDSFGWDI